MARLTSLALILAYAAAGAAWADSASSGSASRDPAAVEQESSAPKQSSDTPDGPAQAGSAQDGPVQTASDDGDRDWGRDDGIATQLSARSKLVVGGVFLVVLVLVVAVIAYRKPDGAAYSEDG